MSLQAHVLLVKLQNSSLGVVCCLRDLVKEKWAKLIEPTEIGSEDSLREVVKHLREDEHQELLFRITITEIYPAIECTFHEAVEAYRIVMRPFSQTTSLPTFDIWNKLYLRMLQTCYIHPHMFWCDHENKLYQMSKSISIMNDTWESFVIEHVPLMAEASTLTPDILREHTKEYVHENSYAESLLRRNNTVESQYTESLVRNTAESQYSESVAYTESIFPAPSIKRKPMTKTINI